MTIGTPETVPVFRRVRAVAALGAALVSSPIASAQVAGMLPEDPVAPAPAAGPTAPATADRAPSGPSGGSADKTFPAPFVIPVFRVGSLAGSGKMEGTCTGNACGLPYESADTEDQSSGGLAADVLFRTTDRLRLGVGAMWLPSPKQLVKSDTGVQAKFASGDEFHLVGVAEGVFPTSAKFALTLRAQAGVMLMVPGEDHEQLIANAAARCRGMGNCQTAQNGFLGSSAGVGGGILFDVGGARLRLDVMLQRYSVPVFKQDISGSSQQATTTMTQSGSRSWLLAGAEF